MSSGGGAGGSSDTRDLDGQPRGIRLSASARRGSRLLDDARHHLVVRCRRRRADGRRGRIRRAERGRHAAAVGRGRPRGSRRRTPAEALELDAQRDRRVFRRVVDRLAHRPIALEPLRRVVRREQRARELGEDLGALDAVEALGEAAEDAPRLDGVVARERQPRHPTERVHPRLRILRRLVQEALRRRHVAGARRALRGGQRDATGAAEPEEVPVDGLGVEPIRLLVPAAERGALREPERDERLRADRRETPLEGRRTPALAVRHILGLGEEERRERDVLRLERGGPTVGAIAGQPLERRDGRERVVLRPGAAEAVLEAAREELGRRRVRREPRGVPRARQRRVAVSRARRGCAASTSIRCGRALVDRRPSRDRRGRRRARGSCVARATETRTRRRRSRPAPARQLPRRRATPWAGRTRRAARGRARPERDAPVVVGRDGEEPLERREGPLRLASALVEIG